MGCKLWFLTRTKEQRRERYAILIAAGFDSHTAYRVRDWRPNKIKGYIALNAQKMKGGSE